MNLKLNGKSALVTASSAGIGFEIAKALAAEGADVILTGRVQEKLDQAAAEIEKATGHAVRPILADAATEAGAETLFAALPTVDILVNNLGIYDSKDFGEVTDDDWRRFFDVNVVSGVRLARHYFQPMLDRNWGRIIFVSSESALMVPATMIHYSVTKAAQVNIARGLAELTKGTEVTVNAVLPGPTRSENIVDFLRSVSEHPEGTPEELEAEFFRRHRPTSLLQRMIEGEEVGNMVAYLASPLAAATNGAAVRVEGGLLPMPA
ncbi:MAG TPA: SDR family oxidoreductase [Alphaproteobacteria bacterium]|jgi:NAD(P)-dependent dehydrogenase (short-subunit alcohol dehydrogenase family)|nr:SDR family oxidoreductase [Alphaproteobacteria bacterium]